MASRPPDYPAVLCSIDRAPAPVETDAAHDTTVHEGVTVRVKEPAVDTSVAIGGVEELLEFVRSSVLAGPRPFSFAFHERSLRLVMRMSRALVQRPGYMCVVELS